MKRVQALALGFFLFLFCGSFLLGDEPRVALVISNSTYRFFEPLTQAFNDSQELVKSLESRGFQVTFIQNAPAKAMSKAVLDWGQTLKVSQTVGLFYYSGHRAMAGGKVYLLGVDADMVKPEDIPSAGLDLDYVLFRMRSANNGANLVFVDSNHLHPFNLPEVLPPLTVLQGQVPGTLIVFAANPYEELPVLSGKNSPFARSLLDVMNLPSLKVVEIIEELQSRLKELTGGGQTLLIGNTFTRPFILNRSPKVLPLKSLAPPEGNNLKLTMISLPGGTFTMGSPQSEAARDPGETPHKVTLSPFRIGKTEVTQLQYFEIMGKNPSFFKGDTLPVDSLTWFEALAFCNGLSKKEGLKPVYQIKGTQVTLDDNADGYRLPTEAQWEYAARAGTSTAFSHGGQITTDQANFNGQVPYENSPLGKERGTTVPVASFPPNPWGLYDIHGNLWEWCWDNYGPLSSLEAKDPKGPAVGEFRVSRGGSWHSNGEYLRSAARHFTKPQEGVVNIGLRVVLLGN